MLKPPRLAKNMHGGGRRHRTASGTGAGGVTALLERHALVRPAQNGSSEIEDVSSEALVLLEHALDVFSTSVANCTVADNFRFRVPNERRTSVVVLDRPLKRILVDRPGNNRDASLFGGAHVDERAALVDISNR